VCACRSWQSGLPNQLNPNRVQESSSRQQECRREVGNQRKPSQPSLLGSWNAHVPHQPVPHNRYRNVVRQYPDNHEQRPPQPVRGQIGNYDCPVAEIGDARKKEISGPREKVEGDTCQEKKTKLN
jgi:hypothetical protein